MPSPRASERSRALAIRSKLGLTQEEFARLLGFSFPTVNRWERGGSRPTGLGAVVLALLESTARAHAPSHVVATLRRALEADDTLPGRAGRSLTVVRALAELELLPPRNYPCGARA